MFSRFVRIHEHDRQTYAAWLHKPCLCVSSRDKKLGLRMLTPCTHVPRGQDALSVLFLPFLSDLAITNPFTALVHHRTQRISPGELLHWHDVVLIGIAYLDKRTFAHEISLTRNFQWSFPRNFLRNFMSILYPFIHSLRTVEIIENLQVFYGKT